MSELQASGVSTAASGASAGAIGNTRPTDATSGEAKAGQSIQIGQSGQTSSSRSEVVSQFSSSSFRFEQVAQNDKLAMLVAMLIQYLLEGREDDNKNKRDPFAGLAGLMMLDAMGGSAGRMTYIESQSSQVSMSMTTTNASAVQATAYGQASGDATSGGAPTGGSLNVVG